jgi:predicted histone-like DNA-binding protein
MAKYKVQQIKNPLKPQEAAKYYARMVAMEQDTVSTLGKKIAQDCTPNEEDCLIVVDGIMKQVVNALKEGKTVVIDRFGTFRPTIKANGAKCPTLAEYRANSSSFNASTCISSVNIIFTPDSDLKTTVANTDLEKYTPTTAAPSMQQTLSGQTSGSTSNGSTSNGGVEELEPIM